MNKEIISKATRNAFREELTRFTLREIEGVFDTANLVPNESFVPLSGGQRRTLVEKYYANIDFSKPEDVRKTAIAFDEFIHKLRSPSFMGNVDDVNQRQSDDLVSRMQRDGFRFEDGNFISDTLRVQTLETPSIIALTEESIAEHVEKAQTKIANGDFAGAITNAYTLVEAFLKEILRQTQTPFKESEGDIKTLYNSVA